jgi:hypothetical protein
MPAESELILRLIQQLQDYEVENKALNIVLAAMRTAHPEFPALELLLEARLYPQFHEDVRKRYKPLLEAIELKDAVDVLNLLPLQSS